MNVHDAPHRRLGDQLWPGRGAACGHERGRLEVGARGHARLLREGAALLYLPYISSDLHSCWSRTCCRWQQHMTDPSWLAMCDGFVRSTYDDCRWHRLAARPIVSRGRRALGCSSGGGVIAGHRQRGEREREKNLSLSPLGNVERCDARNFPVSHTLRLCRYYCAVLNSPPPKDARRVPAAGDGACRPCTDGVPTGYWSKMEGLSSASEVERSWRRPLLG